MINSSSGPDPDDEILAQIVREWDHANGQPPNLETYIRRYPHLETQIREMHEMRQVVASSRPEAPASMPQQLGEFRIVRRLETGGMGEVYETWHERLQRRVAIKVLRHGQHSQLAQDRFMREQHVLAHLHQTNIVPIHTAGRDGELEYFAMPYIDGAALRHVVQTAAELGSTQPERETPSIAELVNMAHKNGTATPTRSYSAVGTGASTVEPTPEHAPISFKPSMEYLRSVGKVIADAATAMHHAHEHGILHRDLKPSNIMVEIREDADGKKTDQCWVIDFGLASYRNGQRSPHAPREDSGTTVGVASTYNTQQNAAPNPNSAFLTRSVRATEDRNSAAAPWTVSGVMGTPPYMAPEQFDKKADARTDIWGLGVTLYELLTLRRAFPDGPGDQSLTAEERFAATRHRVQTITPPRPGSLIPRDLAAICFKAIQKEPNKRYATARVFADDLRRWLRDEPVRAWPIGAPLRLWKWGKRNKGWAATIAATLLGALLVAISVIVGYLNVSEHRAEIARQEAARDRAVEAALDKVAGLERQGRWKEAEAVIDEAAHYLGDGGPDSLLQKLQQMQADLTLVARLDAASLRAEMVVENRLDRSGAARDYDAAFRESGFEQGKDIELAAARIRNSAVRAQLVAALDDWALESRNGDQRMWLLAVARAADPDPWRDRLRNPEVWQDKSEVNRLLGEANVETLAAQTLVSLARVVKAQGDYPMQFLVAAQSRHSGDFWLNFTLGVAIRQQDQLADAVGYYRAALAVRPQSAVVWYNLGNALYAMKRTDEAMIAFQRTIALDPNLAMAHNDLGLALHALGRYEQAASAIQAAIKLEPTSPIFLNNLGIVQRDMCLFDDAISSYRQAIALNANLPQAYCGLGDTLRRKNQLALAIEAYEAAVALGYANAHISIGLALHENGQLNEAIAHYQRAIALDPKLHLAYYNLGNALREAGLADQAIAAYEETIALDPTHAKAYHNLGAQLVNCGRLGSGIIALRKAVDLGHRSAESYYCLGVALQKQGDIAPAHDALVKCLELLSESHPGRPEATELLRRCERQLNLEANLPAILRGEAQPRNAAEYIEYAGLCNTKKLYVESSRLWVAAFTLDPKLADDLMAAHRYNAACAAALAACAKGDATPILDDRERANWRGQALDWLRADLRQWGSQAESDKPEDRHAVQKALMHWQEDRDLAGLRDPDAIAKLPRVEQEACKSLWVDVKSLLRSAQ